MTKIVQRKEIRNFLEQVGSADIVVGILSFNSARTIGHVVRAVQAGLAKYFPDHKAQCSSIPTAGPWTGPWTWCGARASMTMRRS